MSVMEVGGQVLLAGGKLVGTGNAAGVVVGIT
jgi:hypothetical protein